MLYDYIVELGGFLDFELLGLTTIPFLLYAGIEGIIYFIGVLVIYRRKENNIDILRLFKDIGILAVMKFVLIVFIVQILICSDLRDLLFYVEVDMVLLLYIGSLILSEIILLKCYIRNKRPFFNPILILSYLLISICTSVIIHIMLI